MKFFDFLKRKEGTEIKSDGLKMLPPLETKAEGSSYQLFLSEEGFVYAFSNYSVAQIIRDYDNIAPLASAINKLANAVAGLPYTLVEKESRTEFRNHDAFKLLRFPNKEYEKIASDFIKSYIKWKTLDGDVYWLLTGMTSSKPFEMFLLPSDRVNHILDTRDGYTAELQYCAINGTYIYKKNLNNGLFESDSKLQQVLHIANFNTNRSDLHGTSEIKALYYEINQYMHAEKHNLALLKNGARPSGIFALKSNSGDNAILTDDAFKRMQQSIYEAYTGAENAGKPFILEGGLEWQQISLSPKDLDFATLQDKAEEQIYKKLDIPIQLVKSEGTTAGNMTNLRLEFYQNKVIPCAEEFCEFFNMFVLPRFKDGDKFELIIDKDKVDVLLETRIKYFGMIQNSTIHKINEKRKIMKLEEIKGGEVIVDPNGRHIAGEDAIMTVGSLNNNLNTTQEKKPSNI